MAPTIDERVGNNERDIAVVKNEVKNIKEVMADHADNVESSVKRIETAIKDKVDSDAKRFEAIEKDLKEKSKTFSPTSVVLITFLVGLLGIVIGIMGKVLFGG